MAAVTDVEAGSGTIGVLLDRLLAAVGVGSGFSDSSCLFSFLTDLRLSLTGGSMGVDDFFGEGADGGIPRASDDCSLGVTA